MKTLHNLMVIMCMWIGTSTMQAQNLLEKLPDSEEEWVASEEKVLATIDWLENTPIDQEKEKRETQQALLLVWIINSPTVTVELNSDVTPFTKKNPELLVSFIGGYTRYVLQNDYSKDVQACSLAGVQSAIKVYKAGGLKKDKRMEAIIESDNKGELETWVKEQMQ